MLIAGPAQAKADDMSAPDIPVQQVGGGGGRMSNVRLSFHKITYLCVPGGNLRCERHNRPTRTHKRRGTKSRNKPTCTQQKYNTFVYYSVVFFKRQRQPKKTSIHNLTRGTPRENYDHFRGPEKN